ncbi:hypothetical protein CFC21_046477 [Triticum aestivum]|uniref:Uncharacterized protein n=2 Tax=Triticum aestivum TaxID=4565 RepID=A0A3B6GNA6_WHEAT|nr:hypothetical protein CFC21_046477 [Triticum aestivum]
MASGMPWKPLFWERVNESCAIAIAARLADAARLLASPLRRGGEEGGVASMDACASNLGEAFILSSLGTVEVLALRCMLSEDAREQELRPRARAARARAGAAYDEVATSRGHLGAAARIFPRGDLPRSYADREVLAANTAITAALEQLQGVEAALRSSGDVVRSGEWRPLRARD